MTRMQLNSKLAAADRRLVSAAMKLCSKRAARTAGQCALHTGTAPACPSAPCTQCSPRHRWAAAPHLERPSPSTVRAAPCARLQRAGASRGVSQYQNAACSTSQAAKLDGVPLESQLIAAAGRRTFREFVQATPQSACRKVAAPLNCMPGGRLTAVHCSVAAPPRLSSQPAAWAKAGGAGQIVPPRQQRRRQAASNRQQWQDCHLYDDLACSSTLRAAIGPQLAAVRCSPFASFRRAAVLSARLATR